jgi:hypothetical protein
MKLNFVWLMSMLALLFLANVLMVLGYVNQQGSMSVGFAEHFMNLQPNNSLASGNYKSIGTYDNITLKPENGQSTWRGPNPNERLKNDNGSGLRVLDEDHLDPLADNIAKPECCPSSYTLSTGCVCTTPAQRDYLGKRGGNNTSGVGE